MQRKFVPVELIIETDIHTIEVVVSDYYRGDSGKSWGSFDSCYPPEPEEIEFEVINCTEYGDDGIPVKKHVDLPQDMIYDLVLSAFKHQ